MATSRYEWKILVWDENSKQTNKQILSLAYRRFCHLVAANKVKNCIGLPPDILCKLSFHKRVLLKLSAFLLIITLTLHLNRSTLVMCIMFKGKYLLIAVLALYQGVLLRFWLVDLKEKPSLFKSHIKVYHTKTYRDIYYSQYRLLLTRRCTLYIHVCFWSRKLQNVVIRLKACWYSVGHAVNLLRIAKVCYA